MPIFYTDRIHLLYIHIPKTGGMSIEKYFYETFGIERTCYTGYGYSHPRIDFPTLFGKNQEFTLQHLTFEKYCKYGKLLFDIDVLEDPTLIVLATVRNPYDRIISDLYFFVVQTKITADSTRQDIEDAIRIYLNNPNYDYDNHRLPQYKFLIDSNDGKIPERICILKTESLTQDMHELGFTDFHFNENLNRTGKQMNYRDLLTDASIQMINQYYYQDFIYFGYPMIV